MNFTILQILHSNYLFNFFSDPSIYFPTHFRMESAFSSAFIHSFPEIDHFFPFPPFLRLFLNDSVKLALYDKRTKIKDLSILEMQSLKQP